MYVEDLADAIVNATRRGLESFGARATLGTSTLSISQTHQWMQSTRKSSSRVLSYLISSLAFFYVRRLSYLILSYLLWHFWRMHAAQHAYIESLTEALVVIRVTIILLIIDITINVITTITMTIIIMLLHTIIYVLYLSLSIYIYIHTHPYFEVNYLCIRWFPASSRGGSPEVHPARFSFGTDVLYLLSLCYYF